MISQGERPMFRIRATGDGPEIRVEVVDRPWLAATVYRRGDVLELARAIIADELGADPGAFDVVLEG